MTEPRPSSPFIFGVDLDGVCADFYEGIRPLAAEWLGVEERTLTREVSYGLQEWGIDKAPGGYLDFHKWAVTQRGLFTALKPMAGCAQALRVLSKEGLHIRIITHRLFIKYFHRQAVSQTIDWLDHHGMPYWDLCFLQHKNHVGTHLSIDDAEKNILALRAAGHECIIFTNPTNRHVPGGPRAHDWRDVQSLALARFHAWREAGQPDP